MNLRKTLAVFCLAAACSMGTAIAQDTGFLQGNIKRVLLISVDGMHAVDFLNCANGISTVNNGAPYCPTLAALGKTGINYVAASTSKPSDSFPGLTPPPVRRVSYTTWTLKRPNQSLNRRFFIHQKFNAP